jgi:hypothetical protein
LTLTAQDRSVGNLGGCVFGRHVVEETDRSRLVFDEFAGTMTLIGPARVAPTESRGFIHQQAALPELAVIGGLTAAQDLIMQRGELCKRLRPTTNRLADARQYHKGRCCELADKLNLVTVITGHAQTKIVTQALSGDRV